MPSPWNNERLSRRARWSGGLGRRRVSVRSASLIAHHVGVVAEGGGRGYVLDLATREIRAVTTVHRAGPTPADRSPDGQRVVQSTGHGLRITDVATGAATEAQWPTPLSGSQNPVFSPDGSRIAFTAVDDNAADVRAGPCEHGRHLRRNTSFTVSQYVWSRSEKSEQGAMRVSHTAGRVKSFTTQSRSHRATVDLSCSCGSQKLQVPPPAFTAVGALLYFRSFSGRGNHRATRSRHSADSGHCPEGDLTWHLAP